MGRHTPGPWAVGYGMDIIHFEGDGGVQICIPPADKWGAKDWHDNARLISAAPDLLAALEQIVYAQEHMNTDDDTVALHGEINAAKQTIAKAKGE